MNELSRSSKGETEKTSTKPARKAKNGPVAGVEHQLGNRTTRALLDSDASGRGRPLEAGVRKTMETAFHEDFSPVRVHTPENVPRGVGAAASGRHIVFGRGQYAPHSERGKRLIAHELAHVVQQSRSGRGGNSSHLEHQADRAADAALAGKRAFITPGSTPGLQFKIKPEDAASEMVGQTFEVIDSFTSGSVTLSSGDQVKVEKWDASSEHDVEVTVMTGKAAGQKLKVPQRILQPAYTAVAGVSHYSAGVKSQAKAVKKAEDELAAFEATKGNFKTPKAQKMFAEEEKRQETLLSSRRDTLNRKEIQEQMFNRFDAVIASEVAAANTAHGLTGKDALDPNLVKAQLFEESELGTAGEFMSVPPKNPVMTRFNLGQVIDSSGMALLTYMEREQTALITKYNLGNLRKDLTAAQNEKNKLESKPSRSPAEESRLQVLKKKSGRSWEVFIWEYVASGQTQGFNDAVNELFSAPSAKNVDYAFWIHLAILWLFEKKKAGKSWPDTIKAYNGSGAQAEHYKAAIVKRAADAASSQAAGTEFIPTH